jgi:hypothetical protein
LRALKALRPLPRNSQGEMLHWRLAATHFERQTRSRQSRDIRRSSLLGHMLPAAWGTRNDAKAAIFRTRCS